MKALEEIKRILTEHKLELREQFHVQNIALFGSYVRGDQEAGSDIDILIEFNQPVGWEIVDVHRYLEEILGVKVDLVTKRAVMGKPLLWQSIQEDLIYV
jgi:predicted nucleotidyltransferase